ncbi:exodeoxyribonuclease VII small subunit [Fructilactobacillus fructivorans]|uniref:Exodeoxyribonuclease 7 small subunit n=1 Tax=Fructilactobacillus fructivorans TaxID=1614 RepID=A0A0C1PN13_9LACO|nr:exodeoxyribonuclease VII small subunit [Fructilactobacillus fructivorans]KID42147.1 Exodeoxyribonuclease VII small subunit [Fructilactobacillus fructivorans]KRK58587.1 exodeoxyribonuclease VII small subunit [Fructilactobacillus fructivorans]KRN13493.1 exodeoxyribonuclease VII small subunit [Fructilactobacillus fructivorans]KRN40140.1 exodeoxyribonuclease VII small subunit [Fructilactobacillus fructivorans]KRN43528.1 exodeoxyribonuclease VII small subunit [Fructilactobacillus fructivorans]
MADKKPTFEENMSKLEEIVNQLEQGDVPLEKALSEFKDGVELSNEMQKTLSNAQKTLTKMMDDSDNEVPFDRDQQNGDSDDGQ